MKIDTVAINGISYEINQGRGCVDVFWRGDIGFGHVYLYFDINGETKLDSEYITKESVKQIFEKLIDDAKFE